ncbi:MAG: type IV toxin-antitoxin system AbiEi family antitoxin, partial [Actinopolymorphaceae bacterium]
MVSPKGLDRRIPAWAAGVIAGLARDLPSVVTREDIARRLSDAASGRDVDPTINELRRLGWLVGLPIQGTWAFIPPGQDVVADPYLPLRAWKARDDDANLLLSGAAAAWHLGYLDRRPEGRIQVWLPSGLRLPDGLRPHVSVVQIKWPPDVAELLAPSAALLVRRRLDIVAWA